jgi:hypothetical protein
MSKNAMVLNKKTVAASMQPSNKTKEKYFYSSALKMKKYFWTSTLVKFYPQSSQK